MCDRTKTLFYTELYKPSFVKHIKNNASTVVLNDNFLLY